MMKKTGGQKSCWTVPLNNYQKEHIPLFVSADVTPKQQCTERKCKKYRHGFVKTCAIFNSFTNFVLVMIATYEKIDKYINKFDIRRFSCFPLFKTFFVFGPKTAYRYTY